jgi:hypothetical protein
MLSEYFISQVHEGSPDFFVVDDVFEHSKGLSDFRLHQKVHQTGANQSWNHNIDVHHSHVSTRFSLLLHHEVDQTNQENRLETENNDDVDDVNGFFAG